MGDQIQSPLSFDDVVFIEATPEQRTLAWTLNGASWATPMSIPEYVARETYLSQQDLTKNGPCKYWVVHPRDKPDEILCGCEATPKTVLIAGGGQGFRTASSYAIASVYTNPLYRRQGLAAMMLKKLQAWMDSENAACSALYSDIGVTFYANLGWEVFPSDEVSIFPDPNKASLAMPATTRFLKKEDFRALCDEDVSRLTAHFKALENDEKVHVAFCPTYEQLCWHFGRDEFMGRAIHSRDVVNRGAISQDGKAWICWDHDFREEKIKIQRIVLLDHDSPSQRATNLQNLLQAALAEAADWNLRKVVVWNPDEETRQAALAIGDKAALDVVFSRREAESIPSLRWKNGENLEVVWEENQYYAWC